MNLIQKLAQNKIKDLIFYAFLGIYFTLLLYVGYKLNIWEDEAYSLNTTSLGFGQVINQSYHFEGQPPFYFLCLALWRLISPGIFFARILSVIFVGLSAVVLKQTISLFPEGRNSNWIIVIFLLNPFTVWAATEIRTYALLIFLSSLSVYFLTRYEFEKRKKFLLYFTMVCITGLYTQYFFGLLIAAIVLTVLIFKGWKSCSNLCLYLFPVAILFLPNLYFLPDNINNFQSDNPNYSLLQRFSIIFHNLQDIILSINLASEIKIFSYLVRVIFVFLMVDSYVKLYKSFRNQNNSFFNKYNSLLVVTFFTVLFFTGYVVLTGLKFNIRYLATIFPLIVLLFIIFNSNTTLKRHLIFVTLSVYFVFLLVNKYIVPVKTYDYPSIAQYIERIEKPDEPLVMNSRTISIPFEYYYKERDHLVQLPDSFKFTKEGFQVLIKDTSELKLVLNGIKSKSILFVNDNMLGYSSKLKLNTEMLDSYLNSNFKIEFDTLYSGRGKSSLQIRRLVKPGSVHN